MKVWKLCMVLGIVGVLLSFGAKASMREELQCHTDNVFFEANSESLLGQVLVANSVENRTATAKRWGDTDCETIYQKKQYSWTEFNARQLREFKQKEAAGYKAIQESMDKILGYGPVPGFEGVNHYLRCDSRKPGGWWESMEFLGQVGAHCFYRD